MCTFTRSIDKPAKTDIKDTIDDIKSYHPNSWKVDLPPSGPAAFRMIYITLHVGEANRDQAKKTTKTSKCSVEGVDVW